VKGEKNMCWNLTSRVKARTEKARVWATPVLKNSKNDCYIFGGVCPVQQLGLEKSLKSEVHFPRSLRNGGEINFETSLVYFHRQTTVTE
jgi:hypothetical protein